MKKGPRPDQGKTMELDALIDDMEEVDVPDDLLHAVSAPPPLPPEKASKAVWVIGGLVILVAASAAVGLGFYVMGGPHATVAGDQPTPTPAPATPAPAAPAPAAPAEPAAADTSAEEGGPREGAPDAPVVVMDEFVFEGDPE